MVLTLDEINAADEVQKTAEAFAKALRRWAELGQISSVNWPAVSLKAVGSETIDVNPFDYLETDKG